MLIATMLVRGSDHGKGPNYFRLPAHALDIQARLAFLRTCVTTAKGLGSTALLLPAGFFCVRTTQARTSLEAQLLRDLKGSKLLICFGIDESIGDNRWQPYGYVYDDGCVLIGPVHQLGFSTNKISRQVAVKEISTRLASSHLIDNRLVGLVICGELLSEAWRDALVHAKPDLILHPAHASVQLGGTAHESWGSKIEDLLRRLPTTTTWAFADHVIGLGHLAGGMEQPLVRHGGGAAATLFGDRRVRKGTVAGRMIIYQ